MQVKLKIFDGHSYWMNHYAEADGSVYLDISDEFKINLSKEIEQLIDLSKINIEGVLGTTLIATPKNIALVGEPITPNVNNNDYQDFTVQILIGLKILTQNKLRVKTKKETNENSNLEIEIIDTSVHWAVQLNSMYLDELPFVDFDYSKTNMYNNWTLNNHYNDGDVGYYFGLVDFGNFADADGLLYSDFRPHVHALKVLQLAINKAGFAVSCPLLETPTGRKIVTYVVKENNEEQENILKSKEFNVDLIYTGSDKRLDFNPQISFYSNSATWTSVIVKFNHIISNSIQNGYDLVTGKYTNSIYARFVVELNYSVHIDPNGLFSGKTHVVIEFVKEKIDGTLEVYPKSKLDWYEHSLELGGFFNASPATATMEENIFVYKGEKVYLRVSAGGHSKTAVRFYKDCRFYCVPIREIELSGTKLNVKKSLRHDKVIDYLKGLTHLFNFKFFTDFVERKVYILTPNDVNYFGTTISGFYKNTIKQIDDYINQQEIEVIVPRDKDLNIHFKFKDTTDNGIIKLKLDKDKTLHGRFIDNGFGFEDETEDQTNPYFEPTLNKSIARFGAIDLPSMLDNDDNKISTNIQPRILIAAGMVLQYQPNSTIKEIKYFENDEQIKTILTPYMYQVGNAIIDINGNTPTNYICYGDKANDSFNLFYKKYFNEFRNCLKYGLKMIMNMDYYESIYFDEKYKFTKQGTEIIGRILSVLNFNPENNEAEILLKADSSNDPECDTYVEVNKCANFPTIIINDLGGGDYSFSAGGINASPIAATVFEWKFFDDAAYTTGSTFTTTNKKVICRIITSYTDGCITETRTGEVNPCANYPDVCYTKTLVEPFELNVFECGIHADTITSTVYEYSINNGTTWQTIFSPFLLSELPEEILLRVTVYYTNCGYKTSKEVLYSNIPTNADCDFDGEFIPTVVFVTTPAGLLLERKGYFNGKDALDIIRYRIVDSNNEWDQYDDFNKEILSTENGINYEAERIIIFCNGQCPIYCSGIITANNDCAGSVEIVDSSALTVWELKWENPDTNLTNWKNVINNDATFFVPTLRTYIDKNIGGTHTQILERTVIWDRWNFKTEVLFTWNQTDSIKLFKISKNVAGVQTLLQNVDMDIQFVTGNTNEQLRILVQNRIALKMYELFAAVENVNYISIVTITGSGSSRSVGIAFMAKKVVNDTWFGFNATSDYLQTITTGLVTTNHPSSKLEFQEIVTAAPISKTIAPTGVEFIVKYKVGLTNKWVDDAASNFDNIVMNATNAIVTEQISTDITDTDQEHYLSATISGCTTPSYIWKHGRLILGTNSTITTYGNKTIRLFIGCSDSCWYMAEVNQ